MSLHENKVWITWDPHRRSSVLSEQFGASLHVLQCNSNNKIIRYIILSVKTFFLIAKKKYSHVFCQNPSLILAFFLCTMKIVFKYVLVVDRHSNFIIDSKNFFLIKAHDIISDITLKYANFTIITNDYLYNFVNSKGGNALVLQDKLPELNIGNKIKLQGKYNITFITSCSFDEPIKEVISAFERIDPFVNLYITGNYKNNKFCNEYIKIKPKNISFTGYLCEIDYQNLLISSDAIIVLTRYDYILTCGAYEGVSICKPLVLSNTETIKNYFSSGAVYCDPEPESIRLAIEECLNNLPKLLYEVTEFKKEIDIKWKRTFANVYRSIFGIKECL